MIDIDQLIAYETGTLDADAEIEFFADLIATGTAWSLQGSYGRAAQAFIDAGLISETGEIFHAFKNARYGR